MGCVSSMASPRVGAALHESHEARSPTKVPAAAPATPRESARPAEEKPSDLERLELPTEEQLKQLRAEFVAGATPGSVYDAYFLNRTLGVGGFAVVVHGTRRDNKTEMAVKILRMQPGTLRHLAERPTRHLAVDSVVIESDRKALEHDVLREIHILKSLNCPHIMKLHEYYFSAARDKVYIVTELLRGGELLDALLERGVYSERDARTIFQSVLAGVAYLHDKGIAHRDLKLENLLLADKDDLSSVRLADFGMARLSLGPGGVEEKMAMVCGTPTYVAPEVICGRRYTKAVDLWSAGVILYILLSGVVPFCEPDQRTLLHKIARGVFTVSGPEWVLVSEEAKRFVLALMCVNPQQRLSASAALASPWMRSGDAAPATALPAAQGGLRAYAERLKLPVRTYAVGTLLVRQGDPAAEVYLIRSGRCEVFLGEADGEAGRVGGRPSERIIAQRGPGEFIGEMGLLLDETGRMVLPDVTPSGAEAAGDEASAAEAEALDDARLGDAAAGVPAPPPGARVGRRNASVRAVGAVEVLVLAPRHLHWVLAHDTHVRAELVAAMELRQRELRAARDAAAAEQAQGGSGRASTRHAGV